VGFKIKRQADGSIDKLKVRLVMKGVTQIDKEIFSPIVRFASLHLRLTLVAHWDLLVSNGCKGCFLQWQHWGRDLCGLTYWFCINVTRGQGVSS